jgi:hypothetical protein
MEPEKFIEFKLNYLFIRSSKSRFNINKMVVIIFMKAINLISFIPIIEMLYEKNET